MIAPEIQPHLRTAKPGPQKLKRHHAGAQVPANRDAPLALDPIEYLLIKSVLSDDPLSAFDQDPTERLAKGPYRAGVDAYMAAVVHPFVPDAWVDHAKTKVGYEIPLTRQFYRYVPPRPLETIDAEIKALEEEIQRLLREVTAS